MSAEPLKVDVCSAEPMSALGHKPTCATHKQMSALSPIATEKADINFHAENFVGAYCARLRHPIEGVSGGGLRWYGVVGGACCHGAVRAGFPRPSTNQPR
jgi:hypothetical protein